MSPVLSMLGSAIWTSQIVFTNVNIFQHSFTMFDIAKMKERLWNTQKSFDFYCPLSFVFQRTCKLLHSAVFICWLLTVVSLQTGKHFKCKKDRYMQITTAEHASEGPKQAEAVSRVLDKSTRTFHAVILKLPRGDFGHQRRPSQKALL